MKKKKIPVNLWLLAMLKSCVANGLTKKRQKILFLEPRNPEIHLFYVVHERIGDCSKMV